MGRKKQLNPKDANYNKKKSKQGRNERYYIRRKAYNKYITKMKHLSATGSTQKIAFPTYAQFSKQVTAEIQGRQIARALAKGYTEEQIKKLKKSKNFGKTRSSKVVEDIVGEMLAGDVISMKQMKAARHNITARVDAAISMFAAHLATITSETTVFTFLDHQASADTPLVYKERLRAIALRAYLIGGYAKLESKGEIGFKIRRTGKPSAEEFRWVSGNWTAPKMYIRTMLGVCEKDIYGSDI